MLRKVDHGYHENPRNFLLRHSTDAVGGNSTAYNREVPELNLRFQSLLSDVEHSSVSKSVLVRNNPVNQHRSAYHASSASQITFQIITAPTAYSAIRQRICVSERGITVSSSVSRGVFPCCKAYQRRACVLAKPAAVICGLPKNPSVQFSQTLPGCFTRHRTQRRRSQPSLGAAFAMSNCVYLESRDGRAMPSRTSSRKSCAVMECGTAK